MRAVFRNPLRQVLSSSAVILAVAVRPAGLPRSTDRTGRGGFARSGAFASRAARGPAAITSLLDYRAGAFLLPCARPAFSGCAA